MIIFASGDLVRFKLTSATTGGKHGAFLNRGSISLNDQPGVFQSSISLAAGREYIIKFTLLPPPKTRPDWTEILRPFTLSLGVETY